MTKPEIKRLKKRLRVVEKFARWFAKYPEYVPNPERMREVVSDRDKAFPEK